MSALVKRCSNAMRSTQGRRSAHVSSRPRMSSARRVQHRAMPVRKAQMASRLNSLLDRHMVRATQVRGMARDGGYVDNFKPIKINEAQDTESTLVELQREAFDVESQIGSNLTSNPHLEGIADDAQRVANMTYGSADNKYEKALMSPGNNQRDFAYFTVGSARFAYMTAIRATVLSFLASMTASADVLAMSTVEVKITDIPEGTTATVKWRGKPVFIRHRNAKEIAAAEAATMEELKDPQPDSDRVQNPEWLVVLGVCTHLGCVPIANAGEYKGWFCPCHGSHYDTSGRIRHGPAPLNLEVPAHSMEESVLTIG